MTTKSSSQKRVIILISQNNTNTITNKADKHIFNINRLLKSIKSNTIAVRGHSEASQNTLNYSRGGVLS